MEITQEEQKRYEELQVFALDFARQGKTQDLKAMLDASMPINLCDHKGNSLLMLASYNGNEETSQMLVNLGANVDQKNDRGQTPLAGVCFKGYLNIVKILVHGGANIYENNGMGTTPIMFASMFGNYEIVKYLNNQNGNFKSKIYLLISKIFAIIKKIFKKRK
ncbi:ankyrin repeat domain-containing protein [Poseidonibacter antarcticus]|uniref:ankyrin repeat domain-containing protein n=1 Tax=Poseidonibacter antarcticus TaxID=2478538 RepID=UPI000EF44D29|nr:ankyrin repeat domain-containing protein [Poseidonibacter antarcticus]